jgi:hypothetical protein
VEEATGLASGVTPLIHKRKLGLGRVCLWHVHDIDLDISSELGAYIYLFRDPVDVVVSNLIYYQVGTDDSKKVETYSLTLAEEYRKHLHHYLGLSEKKPRGVYVSYEKLLRRDIETFQKIAFFLERFLESGIDASLLMAAADKHTKEKSKKQVAYNSRVISIGEDNEVQKRVIRKQISQMVGNICGSEYERIQKCSRIISAS